MADELVGRLSTLKFGLEKSIRYHHRRRAFFEAVHRAVMFLVILSGSAAAAQIFGEGTFLAIVAVLLAAIDLTYSPGSRARDHIVLHQKFTTLLATISRVELPTELQLREWTAQRLEIEANEPPIYWALEKDCYNEICFARGQTSPDYLYKLTWSERHFMQFWRFDIATPAA